MQDPGYRFGARLAELARMWRNELDTRLKPHGLSQARWIALINLSEHEGGLTQNDLAFRVGIKGPTLVRQLDWLEANGWVERRDSPTDRRVKTVHLTDKARPMLATIDIVARELRREVLDGVSTDEVRLCLSVFERAKRRLEERAAERSERDVGA